MALIAWLLEHARRRHAARCADPPFSSRARRPAMSQSELHHPQRRRLSAAALPPRPHHRSLPAGPSLRILRARSARRFVGHASSHRYYRFDENLTATSAVDRGRLARGSRRQTGRGGRLRAVSARPAARDYECGRDLGGVRIAAQIVADVADPSTLALSAWSRAVRCSLFDCAI